MGCAGSTASSSTSFTGASPGSNNADLHIPTPQAAANTSRVLFSGDGTASQRKLKERTKRGSITFGVASSAEEKEKAAALEKEHARKKADLQQQQQQQFGSGAGPGANNNNNLNSSQDHNNDTIESSPAESGAGAGTTSGAVDETEEEEAGVTEEEEEEEEECSSSESEESDGFDSMEEIEEESAERPIDIVGGGLFSPTAPNGMGPGGFDRMATLHAAPTASNKTPLLQRGSSLHKLLKNFSPENCHILVVDDDSTSQEIVAEWLAAKNYHVTLCNDGEEAVEVLSASTLCGAPNETLPSTAQAPPTEDFDLILSEMSMETPEGLPLLDWVLRNPRTKHIPFVVMSSDTSSLQSADRSLRRGAEDFFPKPLQRGVLLKNIRSILEQRCEMRNSAKLKAWGDKYKAALIAEKKRKELGLPLASPHLTSYGSHSDSVSSTQTPTSQGRPMPPPVGVNTGGAAAAEDVFVPVQPNPDLISNSPFDSSEPPTHAMNLSISVPPDGTSSPQLGSIPLTERDKNLMRLWSIIPGTQGMSLTPGGSTREFSTISNSSASTLGGATGSNASDGATNTELEEMRATVDEATVLLIDPLDSTRQTLSHWFASINYKLLNQPSMEEALEFLRKNASTAGGTKVFRSSTLASFHEEMDAMAGGGGAAGRKGPLKAALLRQPSTPSTSQSQPASASSANTAPFSTALDRLGSVTNEGAVVGAGAVGTTVPPPLSNSNSLPPLAASSPAVQAAQSALATHTRSPSVARSATNVSGTGSLAAGSPSPHHGTLNKSGNHLGVDFSPPLQGRLIARPSGGRVAMGPVCDLIIADAEPFADSISTPPSATSMTGSAFMSALQSNPTTKGIPVILLYANNTSPDVGEAIRQGVETILLKPVSKDLLLKKVNQILGILAQKKKNELFAERAQAYRSILASFRSHREEEIKAGKRGPVTPSQGLQRKLSQQNLLASTPTGAGGAGAQASPSPRHKKSPHPPNMPSGSSGVARSSRAIAGNNVVLQSAGAESPKLHPHPPLHPPPSSHSASTSPLAAAAQTAQPQQPQPQPPTPSPVEAASLLPSSAPAPLPAPIPEEKSNNNESASSKPPTPIPGPPSSETGGQKRSTSNTFTFNVGENGVEGKNGTAQETKTAESQPMPPSALYPQPPANAASNTSPAPIPSRKLSASGSTGTLPPISNSGRNSPHLKNAEASNPAPVGNGTLINASTASGVTLPPITSSGRNSPHTNVPPPSQPIRSESTPNPSTSTNGVIIMQNASNGSPALGPTPTPPLRTNSGHKIIIRSSRHNSISQSGEFMTANAPAVSPVKSIPSASSNSATNGDSPNASPTAASGGQQNNGAGDSQGTASISSKRNKITFVIRDRAGTPQ